MVRGQRKKDVTLELPRLRLPRLRLPGLPRRKGSRRGGPVAAAVTGVVVGLAGVGGTVAGLAGCEAVRGVSTCGGGTGLLLLVGIVAVMVLLGAAVLKGLGARDAGATSFLGVGIVVVVTMLALLEVVYSPWMVLVVPVLTGASYLLAHWVTSRFAGDRGRPDWT